MLQRKKGLDIDSTAVNTSDSQSCESLSVKQPGWALHSVQYGETVSVKGHRELRQTPGRRQMSAQCTDLWLSKGEVCLDLLNTTGGASRPLQEASVDFVWTFVEDTPHWTDWKDAFAYGQKKFGADRGTRTKNFRSYNQLQYSVRSVFQHAAFVSNAFLLSASLPLYAAPRSEDEGSFDHHIEAPGLCRAMQVPAWVNTSALQHSRRLQIIPHWDLFHTTQCSQLSDWKAQTLPVFNSHAIESQLHNVPSDADALIYLNDDIYLSRVGETSLRRLTR